MTTITQSFRHLLRFSKLRKITSRFQYSTTNSVNDLNGKDLYTPKYGNSHYDPQQYHTNFFHTPQCIPHLKEKENEYYDKEDKNTNKDENKKKDMNFFDCENQSWTRED